MILEQLYLSLSCSEDAKINVKLQKNVLFRKTGKEPRRVQS